MTNLIYIIISSISIMLASLIGVVFLSARVGSWIDDKIEYLVSFSAGIFLVIAVQLGLESINLLHNIPLAFLAIISGVLLLYAISIIFPEVHSHHHGNKDIADHNITNRHSARGVLWGDALHNMADGMILAPAFLVSPIVGILTTLGILIHEIIQEVSEYFVLLRSGYTKKEALVSNFLSSSTVIIGAIIGYFITGTEQLNGTLVGVASGVFLFILFTDMLPHSITSSRGQGDYVRYLLCALGGVILIFAVNFLIE